MIVSLLTFETDQVPVAKTQEEPATTAQAQTFQSGPSQKAPVNATQRPRKLARTLTDFFAPKAPEPMPKGGQAPTATGCRACGKEVCPAMYFPLGIPTPQEARVKNDDDVLIITTAGNKQLPPNWKTRVENQSDSNLLNMNLFKLNISPFELVSRPPGLAIICKGGQNAFHLVEHMSSWRAPLERIFSRYGIEMLDCIPKSRLMELHRNHGPSARV
jgi:hypothetical protein